MQLPGSGGRDLRLMPVALGMWVAQAAVLFRAHSLPSLWPGTALAGSAMAATGIATAAWLVRPGTGVDRPCWLTPSALAWAGVGLGLVVISAHLQRTVPADLRRAVAEEAVVGALVRIDSDPWQSNPPVGAGRLGGAPNSGASPRAPEPTWQARGTLLQRTWRGRTLTARSPVLLRGEQVSSVIPGSTVQLSGQLHQPWPGSGYAALVTVIGQVEPRAPPATLARATNNVRAALRSVVAGLPTESAALILGLSVGDESLLPAELDADMVRAGLAHLTAVSGANTTLVMVLAVAIAASLRLGWHGRVLMALVSLLGYVALVGPQPSVMRAAAMGLVALLAMARGGARGGTGPLAAAIAALLVLYPTYATSLGFAMSVAATAGLLVLARPIEQRLGSSAVGRWLPPPVVAALAVAAAAQLATLPMSAAMGNGASLVALPANVLVTPAVPVVTVLGLVAALLAVPGPAAAGVAAAAAAPFAGFIAWVAGRAADVPAGAVQLPDGTSGALWASAGLLVALLLVRTGLLRRARRGLLLAAAAAAMMVGALLSRMPDGWPPPGWIMVACDVGQGDALVLRLPPATAGRPSEPSPQSGTAAVVVDAGGEPREIRGCLRRLGVSSVPVVVISHLHADHVEGLPGVLAAVPRGAVGCIITSSVAQPELRAPWLVDLARGQGIPVRTLRAGESLVLGSMRMAALWPKVAVADSPENNSSLVLDTTLPGPAGDARILLTGDIEPLAQQAVMAGPRARFDVLKVPHHGSRLQDPGFAAWVSAPLALVSAGRDNEYGHPDPSALAELRQVGSVVGRTDVSGDIAVVAGASGWELVARG